MALIANNIFVGGKTISPAKIVEPEKIEVKEEQPKYHEIKDGELHKLINTKSSYLSDMTGFKN